jgi:formate--tetrahydrofolate ligase
MLPRATAARIVPQPIISQDFTGAPSGHPVNIREVRLAAGAEFIVMVCGDIMTMPGLPKVPSSD